MTMSNVLKPRALLNLKVVLIPAVTDCQNVVNPMTDGPCECEPLVHGVSIKERNQGHPDDGSDDARVGVCVNSNGG